MGDRVSPLLLLSSQFLWVSKDTEGHLPGNPADLRLRACNAGAQVRFLVRGTKIPHEPQYGKKRERETEKDTAKERQRGPISLGVQSRGCQLLQIPS